MVCLFWTGHDLWVLLIALQNLSGINFSKNPYVALWHMHVRPVNQKHGRNCFRAKQMSNKTLLQLHTSFVVPVCTLHLLRSKGHIKNNMFQPTTSIANICFKWRFHLLILYVLKWFDILKGRDNVFLTWNINSSTEKKCNPFKVEKTSLGKFILLTSWSQKSSTKN